MSRALHVIEFDASSTIHDVATDTIAIMDNGIPRAAFHDVVAYVGKHSLVLTQYDATVDSIPFKSLHSITEQPRHLLLRRTVASLFGDAVAAGELIIVSTLDYGEQRRCLVLCLDSRAASQRLLGSLYAGWNDYLSGGMPFSAADDVDLVNAATHTPHLTQRTEAPFIVGDKQVAYRMSKPTASQLDRSQVKAIAPTRSSCDDTYSKKPLDVLPTEQEPEEEPDEDETADFEAVRAALASHVLSQRNAHNTSTLSEQSVLTEVTHDRSTSIPVFSPTLGISGAFKIRCLKCGKEMDVSERRDHDRFCA